MSKSFFLFVSACLMSLALANEPISKPSKPSPPKEGEHVAAEPKAESKAAAKEEQKAAKEPKGKLDSKAAELARIKDAQAADDLAAKIADKLVEIRKEKEEVAKAAVRSGTRTALPRHAHPSTPEKSTDKHGEKASPGEHKAGVIHWSYEGDGGPANWAKLDAPNSLCESGLRQSPIDIRDSIRVNLDAIELNYKPQSFSVIDNGHTIQVNLSGGNYLNVSGKTYELVQFHFHRPSEERINGRNAEMVMHLVHKDRDGKLAVLALLIVAGQPNAIVQSVWNNLPLEKNEAAQAIVKIDVAQLLPKNRDYYTYMGSLTTPPCSEGVLWMVMKEMVELSEEQISIFARLYPMNARPIQKPNGRLIKESK